MLTANLVVYPNKTVRTITTANYIALHVKPMVISNMLGLVPQSNIASHFYNVTYLAVGGDVDFRSTTQYAKIVSGNSRSTVNIAVTNDAIVEGDETFTLQLNVPSSYSPSIRAGTLTSATATIVDTSSKSHLTSMSNSLAICT